MAMNRLSKVHEQVRQNWLGKEIQIQRPIKTQAPAPGDAVLPIALYYQSIHKMADAHSKSTTEQNLSLMGQNSFSRSRTDAYVPESAQNTPKATMK